VILVRTAARPLRRPVSNRRPGSGLLGGKERCDPTARLSIPIGVPDLAHPAVCLGIIEQGGHLIKKEPLVGPDQLCQAELHGLRPLGRLAGHQDRFPEGWRLLLDPAGIGHDKVTPLQQKDELRIVDRIDQKDVLVSAKRLKCPPDVWISVHRKDDGNIRSHRNAGHCVANSLEPAIEAFAAMAGHQD
jgi:hypothetical protein